MEEEPELLVKAARKDKMSSCALSFVVGMSRTSQSGLEHPGKQLKQCLEAVCAREEQ